MRVRHSMTIAAPVLAAAALLTACDKAAPAAQAAAAGAKTYELVMTIRPESVEKYFSREKAVYDICAIGARALKRPVAPFVAIPADFVRERETRLRDGASFLEKTEIFGIDVGNMTPEQGCPTKLSTVTSTHLVRDGVARDISIDASGESEAGEPVPVDAAVPGAAQLAAYKVAKTVAGVAMKCVAQDDPVIVNKMYSELCIVDPAHALLTTSAGKPVIAHFRDTNLEMYLTAMVLQPVSLRVGGPLDPAVFEAAPK